MKTLSVADLWMDADQGVNRDGCAFGYIGTDETYETESGNEMTYCGWFFDWPRAVMGIRTDAERQVVIDSLSLDEIERHRQEIPHTLAVEKLNTYLAVAFPEVNKP